MDLHVYARRQEEITNSLMCQQHNQVNISPRHYGLITNK